MLVALRASKDMLNAIMVDVNSDRPCKQWKERILLELVIENRCVAQP